MEISMFLEPVPVNCLDETQYQGKNTLGSTIDIYREKDEFPELENVQLALLGIKEDRGSTDNKGCSDGTDEVRQALYLFFNHWKDLKIADIGDIYPGNRISDTYYRQEGLQEPHAEPGGHVRYDRSNVHTLRS